MVGVFFADHGWSGYSFLYRFCSLSLWSFFINIEPGHLRMGSDWPPRAIGRPTKMNAGTRVQRLVNASKLLRVGLLYRGHGMQGSAARELSWMAWIWKRLGLSSELAQRQHFLRYCRFIQHYEFFLSIDQNPWEHPRKCRDKFVDYNGEVWYAFSLLLNSRTYIMKQFGRNSVQT